MVSIGKPVEDLLADPGAEDNFQYSVEFCGGTHLGNTSGAGAFCMLASDSMQWELFLLWLVERLPGQVPGNGRIGTHGYPLLVAARLMPTAAE